eukprot:2432050-Rhodomonas_salina.3
MAQLSRTQPQMPVEDRSDWDVDVFVNANSSKLQKEGADSFDSFGERFACWTALEENSRAFDQARIARFLDLVKEPNNFEVIGFQEFPYTAGQKLSGELCYIEREFWLEVDSEDAAVSGDDGYVILHVHYAGNFLRNVGDRDRSTITQINIRHTPCYREEAFHRKCKDLDRWRERRGTRLVKIDETLGWKWRKHPNWHPAVAKILAKAERCTQWVRGRKEVEISEKTVSPAEEAAKRRALIIAVSRYDSTDFQNLANVLEDAGKLYDVLRQMGWKVEICQNADQGAIRREIRNFLASEKDEEASMFAFIGHGIEVNGNHYLIPNGAELIDTSHRNANDFELDVKDGSKSVSDIQHWFARKRLGRHPTLFLLDCCRNAHYYFSKSQQNASDGLLPRAALQEPAQPKELLDNCCFIYSTNSGRTASDGTPGRGGPFMNAFVEEMKCLDGRNLHEILMRTGNQLRAKGFAEQAPPYEARGLKEQFNFCQFVDGAVGGCQAGAAGDVQD